MGTGPSIPTATTNRVWIPGAGHYAHFMDRHAMRGAARLKRAARGTWPTPTLPTGYVSVDNSIVPIDGNDTLGDCGSAMAAHTDNVLTFRATGRASTFALSSLEQQYETVSRGDNGLSEDQVTGQIWATPNGIAGASPPGAVIYDHLDIATDPTTATGAIAATGVVCMGFSCPNKWINSFDPNTQVIWDAATPNPANGHFVPLVGVLANGNFILLTWGGSVQLTPAGLLSCDAELFTVFTPRAYSVNGVDWAGRTYQQNASTWVAMGGGALPPSPFGPPVPTPIPTPVPPKPPTPTPTPVTPTPTPIPPVPMFVVVINGIEYTWPVSKVSITQ